MLDHAKQVTHRWAAGLRGLFSRRAAEVTGSERGATTAEYAMILALVVIVLIGVLTDLGRELQSKLHEIIGQLNQMGQD